MKKVTLLGYSIRLVGYGTVVPQMLGEEYEVYQPDDNCRFAQYLFRYAHVWKDKGNWPDDVDVVHWNAGLWDVLELFEDGPFSSIEHYRDMIVRIDRRLRLIYPHSKMIFATSTPCIEEMFKVYKRYNKVTELYNAAAIEIVKRMVERSMTYTALCVTLLKNTILIQRTIILRKELKSSPSR